MRMNPRTAKAAARRRIIGAAVLTACAVLAAACGAAGASPAGSGAPTATIALATSEGGTGLPGWAVVEMGGSSATYNNFWELFVRAAGSAQWKLATPLGVASNGGLTITSTGAGLVAGFQPSQDLTFSPLATAASSAAAWSQDSAPVSPGLASVPDALAAGPAGQILALTRTGEVLLGAHDAATWSRLATLRSIASSTAGRACGLTALTAVAFTPAGAPVAGGACSRAGSTGIFVLRQGSAPAAALPLPGGPVTVLALAREAAGRTMALLETGTGRAATIVAAWLTAAGGATYSAAVAAGGGAPRSVAMWSNGSAGLVLADGRAEAIAGPSASWHALPPLPAHAATLAVGASGQLEALTATGGSFEVWQLAPSGTAWTQAQHVSVDVPYGSSD
jgi:trimeric autotransporter adhesin